MKNNREPNELKFDNLKEKPFVYHGSVVKLHDGKFECNIENVSEIKVDAGNIEVDFGQGFYLADNYEQAERRVKRVIEVKNVEETNNQSNQSNILNQAIGAAFLNTQKVENFKGFILKYKINIDDLNTKFKDKYKIWSTPSREWMEFIFNNRKGIECQEPHNQDKKFVLVYGYMADGRFRKIIKYLQLEFGKLNIEQINEIFGVFKNKKEKMETQLSIHTIEAVHALLENGEKLEIGGVEE